MIVLDASAALAGLLNDGPARLAMGAQQLHAPHLIDFEVASGLRRLDAAGSLSGTAAEALLAAWIALALTRHPASAFLGRAWEMRENLSVYDAGYIALAEGLGCTLLTADARLARAPGVRCPVTVVPR